MRRQSGLTSPALSLSIITFRDCMYDTGLVILRILVDCALNAIRTGVYSGSIGPFDRGLIAATGEMSDAAIHVRPSGPASTFTPIETRLQPVVDRRLRERYDPLRRVVGSSL